MRWLFRMLIVLCLLAGGSLFAALPANAQAAPESPRAARIKADVRTILSSPEYQVAKPGESPLDKFGKWLHERWDNFWDWFRRIFSFGTGGKGGGGSIMPWIVLIALILGIAYVIALAIVRWAPGIKVTRKKRLVTETLFEEESASAEPDDLLAAAERYAKSGDFRRAYRAAFVAILLRMDRMGFIKYDRARTNGEYLRSLRGRPSMMTLVRPLVNDFDFRWYGGATVAETDYRRFLQAYEQVKQQPV
jgi:hypothetical protein